MKILVQNYKIAQPPLSSETCTKYYPPIKRVWLVFQGRLGSQPQREPLAVGNNLKAAVKARDPARCFNSLGQLTLFALTM